jgi:hypothetical protein
MNKQQAIDRAADALVAALKLWGQRVGYARVNGDWLSDDDIAALGDGSQWPAMLADWQARIGLSAPLLNQAADYLLSFADESEAELQDAIEETEAAIVALPDAARDAFASLTGQAEELKLALSLLSDARHHMLITPDEENQV